MRLYLIRHADPDYAHDTITPAGHREAQALARRLAHERLDRVYCSPLGRALRTMQYTADLLALSPVVEAWTQEMAELHIELTPGAPLVGWDVPGEVIRGADRFPAHDTWHSAPPFEDPIFRARFEELKQHSDAFLERHGYRREGGRYRCLCPNRERIAIFCHGGFGLTWLAHLLEIPVPLMWSGFWLPPSSVTTILFDERSAEWAVPRCIGLGDVSHLHAAGLPVQPAGIKANFD
jgi:broad specificity phosphatase PhoE